MLTVKAYVFILLNTQGKSKVHSILVYPKNYVDNTENMAGLNDVHIRPFAPTSFSLSIE
jgi:hypothetical protein